MLLVDLLDLGDLSTASHASRDMAKLEILGSLGNELGILLFADKRIVVVIGQLAFERFFELSHHDSEYLGDLVITFFLDLLKFFLEELTIFFGEAHAS